MVYARRIYCMVYFSSPIDCNINTLASNVSIYVCLLGTANCYMVKRRVGSDISFKIHQCSTTTISHHRPVTTGSFFDKRLRSMSSPKVEQHSCSSGHNE